MRRPSRPGDKLITALIGFLLLALVLLGLLRLAERFPWSALG